MDVAERLSPTLSLGSSPCFVACVIGRLESPVVQETALDLAGALHAFKYTTLGVTSTTTFDPDPSAAISLGRKNDVNRFQNKFEVIEAAPGLRAHVRPNQYGMS